MKFKVFTHMLQLCENFRFIKALFRIRESYQITKANDNYSMQLSTFEA